jgi:ribonuclease E
LPTERLEELALYEAYRTTIVMEDGHAEPMPVIQAVLRSQLQSAAGGNVRAQRDILAMIRDIEQVRSIIGPFETGGADDVVDDIGDADDADAIEGDDAYDADDADTVDGDGNDVNEATDADRDDAGSADDDEPVQQQVDGIDTYGKRRQAEREATAPPAVNAPPAGLHPPLKGEGRIAEGDPGWGGGGAGDDNEAVYAEALSPPPGPLTRADLPPPGGGKEATSFAPAGRKPALPSGSGSGQRRGIRPGRNGPERSAGVAPARPQPGRRRRSPAVNAGKIREGIAEARGVRRAGRMPDPARPGLQTGTPARRPRRPNETKN